MKKQIMGSVSLALLVLAGCSAGSGAPAPVAVKPGSHFTQLQPAEERQLIGGGLHEDSRMVLTKELPWDKPDVKPTIPKEVTEAGYSGDIGYLRNPGVGVTIIRTKADGSPIGPDDREAIRALAEKNKLKVWPHPKVDPVLGPDGKTPMVLRSAMKYEPAGTQGTITSLLTFPTKEGAESARRCIGPGYMVTVAAAGKAWQLSASFRGDLQGATDEMDEFDRLAKAFGGSLMSTGGG